MRKVFTIEFLSQLNRQMKQREIKTLPEQIAFNLIMSIVPLVIVIVQLTTYFSLSTNLVEYLIISYAPKELQALLTSLFQTPGPSSSTTLLLITTGITFFWLISKGFYGISSAANITYQVPRMKFAYLERIFAFLTVCLMLIFLIIGLILYVFGQVILFILLKALNVNIQDYFLLLLNTLQLLIGFSSYFIFFIFLFYFAPSRRMKLKSVIPGAIITSIGWSLASSGFSFYVNSIAQYSKFYGSLSVIIILLFWLYLLGFTIVLGLQINYLLELDSQEELTYEARLPYRKLKLSEFVDDQIDE